MMKDKKRKTINCGPNKLLVKDSVLGALTTSLFIIIPRGRCSPFVTHEEIGKGYHVHIHALRK